MKTIVVDQPGLQEITLPDHGEIEVILAKPGAEARIFATVMTQSAEQKKLSLIISHQAPHTSAQTVLKGVADGKSSLNLYGKIVIKPNCPDVQSFLKERILLLSDQAHAVALPELEIESDNVSCSHAASIAPIPENEIFYLMSRGLSRELAKKMLVDGFLASSH